MKNIFKSIIAVFVFSLMTLQLSAQCSQTLNNNNTIHPTVPEFGQSFTASCGSGSMFTNLQVMRKGGANVINATLYLHSGESTDPSTVIYSQAAVINPYPGSGSEYHTTDIPLGGGTGNLTFTDGDVYTFRIVSSSGNFVPAQKSGNVYTTGKGYWPAGGFRTGEDFYFSIETGDPVPTMGEWALITFGLIIMSMGVITVRRREEEMNLQAAS